MEKILFVGLFAMLVAGLFSAYYRRDDETYKKENNRTSLEYENEKETEIPG